MDTIYMRRDDRGIRWCNQAVPVVGAARPDIWIWIELAKKMAALRSAFIGCLPVF